MKIITTWVRPKLNNLYFTYRKYLLKVCQKRTLSIKYIISFLFIAFLLSSCALYHKSREEAKFKITSHDILSMLEKKNNNLKTFKGIGKIEHRIKDKSRFYRAAWAGIEPEKLRVEILDIFGRSFVSLSNTGRSFYMLSRFNTDLIKSPLKDYNFNKLLSLPIKFSHLRLFLAGQIPIINHDFAVLEQANQGDLILNLKRLWGQDIEKIYLHKDDLLVYKVELFDMTGDLLYKAELSNNRKFKEYSIFQDMKFSDDSGTIFNMSIERYFVDVNISPSIFKLEKQNSKNSKN